MAASTNIFSEAIEPVAFTGIATGACTDYDTPTNMVDVVAIADNVNGMELDKVYAMTRGTITTAVVQLYKRVGSTYTLINTADYAAVTPSATVKPTLVDFLYSEFAKLRLHPGEGLAFGCSIAVADGVVCRAQGKAFKAA